MPTDDDVPPPVGARFHRPPARGGASSVVRPAGPVPFGLVRRGYDRAQVDGRLAALEAEVQHLRESLRQVQAERDAAQQAASSLRPDATGGHDVEDKIARVARHDAARVRVTALADAAQIVRDASARAHRADVERAAADRELAVRSARVEERERRLDARWSGRGGASPGT